MAIKITFSVDEKTRKALEGLQTYSKSAVFKAEMHLAVYHIAEEIREQLTTQPRPKWRPKE